MKILGDFHNNQAVYLKSGIVTKPRTVFWEYCFLDKRSELRKYLELTFQSNNLSNPFDLFQNVEIDIDQSRVTYLNQAENQIQNAISEYEAIQIGSFLGLMFWFGIGDLHFDNVIVNTINNRLFITPIDIEVIFDNLLHVKQSLLLPTAKVDQKKCGLSRVLDLIKNTHLSYKAGLIENFIKCVQLLNSNLNAIEKILIQMNYQDKPIRVIIKDTMSYADKLIKKDLHIDEIAQIYNDNIPYFFRYIDSKRIYYRTGKKLIHSSIDLNETKSSYPILNISNNFKLRSAILSLNYLTEIFLNDDILFQAKFDNYDLQINDYNLKVQIDYKNNSLLIFTNGVDYVS